MRNLLLSITFLFTSFVFSQIVNIPDANFKAKLLEADTTNDIAKDLAGNYTKIDINNDGEIQVIEAENISELNISSSNITSLEGINIFKESLEVLDCSENELTNLDLQEINNLIELNCSSTNLTELDLSNNSMLLFLSCNLTTNLKYLNLKNGSILSYKEPIGSGGLDSIFFGSGLKYVCVDEDEMSIIQGYLLNDNIDAQVSTNCVNPFLLDNYGLIGVVENYESGWNKNFAYFETQDDINYNITLDLVSGDEFVIRKNDNWDVRYGADKYGIDYNYSGQLDEFGSNFKILNNGTYDISFNIQTKEISINCNDCINYGLIGVVKNYESGWNKNFAYFETQDDINYNITLDLVSGDEFVIRKNDNWEVSYRADKYGIDYNYSGQLDEFGSNFKILNNGTYDISFNVQTKEISINCNDCINYGLIGVVKNYESGWNKNFAYFETQDDINYNITLDLVSGDEFVTPKNDNWDVSYRADKYGIDYNYSGQLDESGSNFKILNNGTYDISFNVQTKEISINCTTCIEGIIQFTDYNFKSLLLNASSTNYIAKDLEGNWTKIDINNDGEIQVSEAEKIGYLHLAGFSSLEGIQYFININELFCSDNLAVSVDLSSNVNLEKLTYEYGVNLEMLNINNLTNLKYLKCYDNHLASLDLSNLPNIKEINLIKNELVGLSVKGLQNLESLTITEDKLLELNLAELNHLRQLNLSFSLISLIDLSSLQNLLKLELSHNKNITDVDLSYLTQLQEFKFTGNNKVSNLNFNHIPNLTTLEISNNELIKTIDFSSLTNLISLTYGTNSLITELDLSPLKKLETFYFHDFIIENINLSPLINLIELNMNYSSGSGGINDSLDNLSLKNLSINNLKKLETFRFHNYKYVYKLDLSSLTNLKNLDIYGNNLKSIILKNGSRIEYNINILENPNLKYICVDEEELEQITQYCQENNINAEVNTYCSFEPAGEKNTITGKIAINCEAEQGHSIKLKKEDGTDTGYLFSDANGNYETYGGIGTYTLTPIFEHPYYTISPSSQELTFTDLGNTETVDFCITPIANKNDVEVKIIPIRGARPGFDADYKLVYKNKGTTTLNGNLEFYFNDDLSDFVSSSEIPFQENGKLTFDYIDLKPFESREILVTLNLNTPTEEPALIGGEVLSYTAIINPTTNDETLEDNTFELKQTVVNSFDPNDKTCLQGTSITADLVGKYVDYLIRFENTGSAEAINIVVKDMIDTSMFDVSTLIPTDSSHDYELRIDGNKVEFIFEGINLPFTEPEKHGYVAFKIRTLPTLNVGDIFTNKADIYFDFNPPVPTDPYDTKIETLSSEEILRQAQNDVSFFPNPASEKVTFNEEVQSVQIFNLSGQLLQTSIVNGTELNVSELAKGNYILKITTEKGIAIEKLIKE
ncbi:MAG: T9SS type A sorting domain-containing protein [Flavobacteriales bacterium]|nr:T9SS type A sorting domain-containing protein [Flavobacteriales bacterium]